MKTIKARVESAILDDKATGIFITYTDITDKDLECPVVKENQKGVFIPKETLGKIPADKNSKEELQKIADLFNGITREGGRIEVIQNWTPRIINIEIDS